MPPVNRDRAHERHLVAIAAMSEEFASIKDRRLVVSPSIDALNAFADQRAHAGGVIIEGRPVPLVVEAAEELADARSYLVWRAQSVLDAAIGGEPVAVEAYGRAMGSLAGVLAAWTALTRP